MNDSSADDDNRQPAAASRPSQHDDAGRERVSALMDGQLRGAEVAQALGAMERDAQLHDAWQSYHLVGDLLRHGKAADLGASAGFAARVSARLAQEPKPGHLGGSEFAIEIEAAVAVPASAAVPNVIELRPPATTLGPAEAANAPLWRWRAAAGVATLVAVGAIGWNLLGAVERSAPLLARSQTTTTTTTTATTPPQMLRDARLDELLAAHEQSAGVSALQMPAGFLRNATFEGRGR